MPFARGLFLRQESPISRKTFSSKKARRKIRLNYKPLTRQESPISRKTFPSKNARQRIRLKYKPLTRQKSPISRKTFLLKNPEQGMHLGWKRILRRRWGMHERMRGERWRGRRILRRWRRKTGRGRPIRSTFEGHQLAIGAGVYLCGHFCRLFFHIQAQTVPIMHRKTAKSKNCITSSDQRIE